MEEEEEEEAHPQLMSGAGAFVTTDVDLPLLYRNNCVFIDPSSRRRRKMRSPGGQKQQQMIT